MSLVIAFDEELNGEVKSGGNFPKLGHAYTARITTVEESENGKWINVGIEGVDFEANQYDSLSYYINGKYTLEQLKKLSNNVIASNPSMSGAKGNKSMDMAKWSNKGLEIGVVYGIQKEADANGVYQDSKWVEPNFAIPVNSVEDWTPDIEAYEAHQAKFWDNSDDGEQQAPVSSTAPTMPADEDLPF